MRLRASAQEDAARRAKVYGTGAAEVSKDQWVNVMTSPPTKEELANQVDLEEVLAQSDGEESTP